MEVEELLYQILELLEPNKITQILFKDWYNIWFNTYKLPNLKANTTKGIQYTYKKYMCVFNDKYLSAIKAVDVQTLINSIDGHRAKAITLCYLSNMFKFAVENKYCLLNPCDKVKIKKCGEKGSALTLEEQELLLGAVSGTELWHMVLGYIETGCRRNELIAINIEDIDFVHKRIHINKMVSLHTIQDFEGLKTEKSNRFVPITDKLMEYLLSCQSDEPFKFSVQQLSRKYKKVMEKLGFSYTIHSLRHTFATNCVRAGVPMKQIQLWLGHSKFNTTADIYTDVDENMTIEYLKLLNKK